MEIGYQSNPIAPGVRAKAQPILFTEMRYLQPKAETTTKDNIRLQNIRAAVYHEFAKIGGAPVQLADGDTQRCGTTQLGKAGEIGVIQWLFKPVDAILLEFSSDIQCPLQVPGPTYITGHTPPLVRINHDFHRVSDRFTNT